MNKLADIIVNLCLRQRYLVVGLIILITSLALLELRNLKSDSGFDHWFDNEEISYANYKDFVSSFGTDQYFIIIERNDSLLSPGGLARIKSLTKQIADIDGVNEVLNITTVQVPHKTPFGVSFIDLLPDDSTNITILKQRLAKYESITQNLISHDHKTAVYHIFQDEDSSMDSIFTALRKIIDFDCPDGCFFYSGNAVSVEATKIAGQESLKYIVISLLLITIMVGLIFRNLLVGLIPGLIALVTTCWTLAIFTVFEGKLDMISGVIPLLIIIVSATFSVHLLTKFKQTENPGSSFKSVALSTYRIVFKPGLFAALTTALAILSFTTSRIGPIRMFGLFTAIGVLLTFIIGAFLVFILLDNKTGRSWLARPLKLPFPGLEGNLIKLVQGKWKKRILAGCLLLLIFTGYGIGKLEAESDVYRFFKPNHHLRVAKEKVDRWFDGVMPLEVIFTTKANSHQTNLEFLHLLQQIEAALKNVDEIKSMTSINSIGLLGNESLKTIDKRLLYSSNNIVKAYYAKTDNHFRLTLMTPWNSYEETAKIIESARAVIDNHIKGHEVTYFITGVSIIYGKLNADLLRSQILSILLSLLIVTVILAFLFKKAFLVMLGIIPNILPLINTLGLMGYLGISLDVGTILIASLALGVAIDDTIYFLTEYTRALKEGIEKDILLQHSLQGVSKALVFTTIIIAIGFITMINSAYLPIVYLGSFVAINITLALLYDIVVLPIILGKFK